VFRYRYLQQGGSVSRPENQAPLELYAEPRQKPSQIPVEPDPDVQRKRMLIALGVLLVALVAVILKDLDFWFPPSEDAQEATAPRNTAVSRGPATAAGAPASKSERKQNRTPAAEPAAPFSATAERTVLPPLQVEVVAGNRRTSVPARSNAIHLDMASGAASPDAPSAPAPAGVAPADRVQLSPQTAQNVTVSVPPDYPMLARQMKVQGAVILQALISREGSIQELQIVSGPGILAAAAREAVKQWRFKPYYQSGQPVETQARITVNFTISTN
jgi:TonB family protein